MRMIGHEQWIDRLVILGTRWAVYSQWTKHAISILERIMAVIPSGSVLFGNESISKAIPWSNWTLGHSGNAIHKEIVFHADTVHMHRGPVVLKVIFDGNF